MTAPEPLAPPVTPPIVTPVAQRPRSSVGGVLVLVGAALITFLYFAVKLFAAALNADPDAFDPTTPSGVVATLFGVLGLLAIIPVVLVIVFGHLVVRPRRDGSTAGRIPAAIGLGAGYVHLVAWLTRLLVALVLVAQGGDVSVFISNIFWWA